MTAPIRASLALFAAFTLTLAAGCGGSGSGSSGSPGRAASTRVRLLLSANFRAQTQSPIAPAGMATALRTGPASGGGAAGASVGSPPLLGAFIRAMTSGPGALAGRAVRSIRSRSGRDGVLNSFYYDEFLGLWVQIATTADSASLLFFEDEAKTKPAGSMLSSWPADLLADPLVFESRFEITAGTLAGSRGSNRTTLHADGSGDSVYETVYGDTWRDSGRSSWSAAGGCKWSFSVAHGAYTVTGSGEFLADGSGHMKSADSDGFSSEYWFSADGSGRASIAGPVQGLPAEIRWDATGKGVIRYADGTEEAFEGWWLWICSGMGGSSGGGTGTTP